MRNRKCGFCGSRDHKRKDCPKEKLHAQWDQREERRRDAIRQEVSEGIRCGRCGSRTHHTKDHKRAKELGDA